MKDPFSILGVSPNATDDQVKEAYREKLNEYQEHRFSDTPEAAEAEEKILELNQAYDSVMIARQEQKDPGPKVSSQSGPSGPSVSTSEDSQFLDVRRLIQSGRTTEADELLNGVPPNRRDAEWYFLKGTVQYSRGWLEDAYENFERAAQMDPGNKEYQATINQLRWQRQTGQRPQGDAGSYRTTPPVAGCSICDVCTTLYCARCCCQCTGMNCY